jgi:hypothetical protein
MLVSKIVALRAKYLTKKDEISVSGTTLERYSPRYSGAGFLVPAELLCSRVAVLFQTRTGEGKAAQARDLIMPGSSAVLSAHRMFARFQAGKTA